MQAMKTLLPIRKLLTEKPAPGFKLRDHDIWPQFGMFAMWFSKPTDTLAIDNFNNFLKNPDATYGK